MNRTHGTTDSRRSWPRLALPAVLVGALAGAALVGSSDASTSLAPQPAVSGQAQQATTALANALVAAVVSLSDATPPGTPLADVEANSQAVSLLVPSCQDAYGLIDASGAPLDPTNVPKSQFEAKAVMALVGGAPVVQETIGNQLRTLVPLTSDMHANCMTCHSNYAALPPGTVVGAASFKVKL